MLIKLERKKTEGNTRIGRMKIGSNYFCDTIENMACEIAPGVYPVRLTYSPHFEKVLPLLDRVIGRTGIRIHAGNVYKDSEGCILVGEYEEEQNRLVKSRLTLEDLINQIRGAAEEHEPVYIEIMDASRSKIKQNRIYDAHTRSYT